MHFYNKKIHLFTYYHNHRQQSTTMHLPRVCLCINDIVSKAASEQYQLNAGFGTTLI